MFVGNVALDATQKQLKKHFKIVGPVEKVWFRSVPIGDESKKPKRAKIITKELGNSKDSKNAYVLYTSVEDAKEAKIKLN